MKTNNIITNFYENICDEDGRLNRTRMDSVEYHTTMKYIKDTCPVRSKILDACAGTGVYSFPLAELGYKVTAGDLVTRNVDIIKEKQMSTPIIDKIYMGSIMDLSRFKDESFDTVLNLGSFYHLQNEEDRKTAIMESLRVLKHGGHYFMSYVNKHANYVKYHSQMKSKMDIFIEYIEKGYDKEEQIFYGSTPEEVEAYMLTFGLSQMHNVATDGLKFVVESTVNSFDDSQFNRWLEKHYQHCEIKSLLGYSEHGLYIGRKI